MQSPYGPLLYRAGVSAVRPNINYVIKRSRRMLPATGVHCNVPVVFPGLQPTRIPVLEHLPHYQASKTPRRIAHSLTLLSLAPFITCALELPF